MKVSGQSICTFIVILFFVVYKEKADVVVYEKH